MLINTDTDTPSIDTNTNLSPSFIHVDDEKNTQESEESHRLQHTAHCGTSDVAHELLDKHHLSNGQGVSDRVTRASGEGDDIRVQTSIAPSRYIRAISHQWDHRLELIDLMLKFREAITCILKYAIHHINLLKKKIYESFGVTENTRSKFREIRGLERVDSLECLNHQSHQQKTDLEKSPDCIKMEDETNLLKNITHKCNDILEELSAHIGPYTDRFKAMVISVINEVNEVKWSFLTDEQAVGILIDGLPTFRMEGLLECAMEIPPAIRSKEGLKLDVNEISCWTPRVERGELKNPSKKTTKPSTVESVTEIESESGGLVILKDENTPKVLDEKKDSNISKVTRHITHPTNPNQNVINPLKNFNSLVCPGGALPFTFRVTASCYDHTEVTLTRLYVGTHCGAVLSVPFDQVVGDDHLTSGCCSDASDVKDGPTEVAKYTELGALSNKEDQKRHETHLEGSHKKSQ